MNTLREAAQQALEALEALQGGCTDSNDGTVEAITVWCPEIIDALKAALAEPVQEPVAWKDKIYESLHHQDFGNSIPLYTAPPQRKPLRDEELDALAIDEDGLPNSHIEFARAIERAHGIGGSDD